MSKLRLRMHSLSIFHFAITLTVLLIFPLSLFLQTSSFSLSLDLDSSEGDQSVQSLDVSPNRDVSIQIFGTDIQSANALSARFEYNATHVVYTGFDVGDVLPNPFVTPEEGTNPTFVEINIASLDGGSATVNSGLIGTIRFRTTDAFSSTEIQLVRAEFRRGEQVESVILTARVELDVAVALSPDFDGDGFVGFQDLSLLTGLYGYREGQEQYEAKYDLNGDGEIGLDDFLIFIKSYGKRVKHAPVFRSRTYVTHFIDENTPGSEPIGDPISATDADGDVLTYSLSGTDVDLFVIDAHTGQIQTREGITYDYEHRTTYSVIVEVSDGQGGTARLLVVIKINDLKEPPSSPPSNFLVIPDNESLTVHYAAVPDERGRPPVRGYHAEIRKGEEGEWGTRTTIYGRTNTSVYYHEIDVPRYYNSFLENDQLYQVRVRAWNSDGASDWSEPVSGVPVYVPPKEEPKLVQFQGEGDMASANIDLSFSTGEGGRIKVMQASLPATIPQEEVEGIFVEIVEVDVSNAPDVPAQAGFTLLGSSSLFDIELKARVNNQDVDIGDALQASVEICLPVPAEVSEPVIIHYNTVQNAWTMLDRQRVDGDVVCGYTDMFSLFGVVEIANRAPVVVGAIEPQVLRVGGEGVTVDVSGSFNDPDSDVLTYTAVSDDEAIATVDVSGSMVRITPVTAGSVTITVTAQDVTGSNQSANSTIFITVEPVNQVPVFTSGPTFTVSENSTVSVVTVSATDADASDSITGYAIVTGADGAQFSIGSSTGVLTFKTAPNYEDPKDVEVTTPSSAAEDNEYIVIVSATSGTNARALSAMQTITVTVTDVTEAPGKPSAPTVSTSTVNSLTVSWSAPTNTGPEITAYDVRYILSSASAQDKADATKWTVQTDAWTSGVLEYTISSLNQNTSYDVQVRAESDEGTGDWSDSVTGTTAQNQAPVFASVSPISVAENSTVSVATVSATDADNEDSITGYGIVTGADGSQFSLVAATGVLTFKTAPNYESPTDVAFTDATNTANNNAAENNEYIVMVTATGGTGSRALTTRDTLKVTVTDVTEPPGKPSAPTVSTSTVNSLTVSWSAPMNTGPEITAYDVRYILSSASTQDKADDTNWTVQTDAWTSGALEYTIGSLSQNTSYDVQVRAESDEGTSVWSGSVTGTTAQNRAPVITSTSSFTVSENITTTTTVGTVSATDADASDSITGYAIVTGADGAQFSIVEATGVLTFKTAPNYEAPTDVEVTTPSNAAENNEYIVMVTATGGSDARALTTRDTLKVTVTDVTEAPGKPSAPTVSTSTVNSLTVSWSVPTNTGPEITAYDMRYILSSASAQDKADATKWTVQTDAWTSGSLAYTISSLDENTSYDIQVRAENAEGTGDWSDSVKGTTAQNRAPVITSASSFTVSENITTATTVGTVTATDADASDSITGYAIVTGADGAQFSIVEATGVLTFKTAPNYEAPTDVEVTDPSNAASNNEYIVMVTATSGANARALTTRDTLKVTVTDVTEAPGKPSAPTVSTSTVNSLTVSWSAPTNTGPTISAYDVRYILTSASDENKADDTNWTLQADAWTSGALEYTIGSLTQNTGYDIQVRAESDEGTGDWSDSVKGTTAQNQAPVITSASSFTVSENITTATTVGTVTATDADASDSITGYAIVTGADGAQFSIVEATGVLTFKTAPNYEDPADVAVTDPSNAAENNEYIVVVSATSGANARVKTATQTITVTVTDVTEAPGKPSAPTVSTSTVNSLTVSWSAPTNTGPAITAYDVRYILTSASASDKADATKWTVQTDAWTSGDLAYTISSLDENTSYDIQVRAESDEGTGDWSDSVKGTTAQNRAPVLASVSPISVAENSTVSVVTVSATDADASDSITGYAIVTGADGSQFSIVAATGVLTFKTAPNYEDPKDVAFTDATNTANNNAAENNEYIVMVTATGGTGSQALTVRDTLKVTVTDVTEAPGKPSAPTVSTSTVNSLTVSWSAPTNTGPEISAYDVRYILTSASDENKADATNWTVQTDAWTSGDLEYTIGSLTQNTSYDVQVRAESDEGTSVWSGSVTGTTAQNRAPVITSTSSFTVSENITTATTVATVSATDADASDSITGYAIVTGADGAQFSIVAATGVLTFKTAPNYESPTDVEVTDPSNSAENNEYIVMVTATGGTGSRALTARDTLKVTVTDVTEAPGKPSAPTVSTSTVNSLTVSWSVPTNTGPEITAYDVRYILTSASDENKADDTNWTLQADAWTSGALEYTIGSLTQNTSYDVQVRAESDEGTGDWSDSVKGTTGIATGICDRTSQVQSVILSGIDGVTDCALVTDTHLSGIRNLDFRRQNIMALKANDFSGLSDLRILRLDINKLRTFPANVFSGLSNLRTLRLNDNKINTLPAGVFSGLSSPGPTRLTLDDNPGAPFKLTLQLERTDNMDLTAAGPATIKVKVAEGAPFDMTVGLSVTNGTLTDANGSAVTEAMISSGSTESAAITVTQSGSQPVIVSLTGNPPAPPTAYEGLNTALGSSLVLFGKVGICDRTSQVQSAILSEIDGVTDCALVTDEHLALISSLNLHDSNISTLLQNDFSMLSNLQSLSLYRNRLSTLPEGIFSGLSNLQTLHLDRNQLSTLPADVFSGLSNLQTLSLGGNGLSTLSAGVFSGLSNLQILNFNGNELSTLPAGVFSGLSNLQILNFNGNELSTLPAGVFSGLSNLQSLYFNDNELSTLPAGVFSGLSSLRRLDLSDNPGARFTLTLQLERTDNMDLTAAGPATIKVKVAEGAPFDMTVGLSATDGTLTDADGSAVIEAMISAGSTESAAITVTQSGAQPVIVSLTGNPPAPPMTYEGLNTALGSSLVLFGEVVNRAPEAVGTIPAQTLTEGGDAVTVDVSSYFSDPDNDPLTYEAVSSDEDVVTVAVSDAVVEITPQGAGSAAVTVTVSDPGGLSTTQKIAVQVKNTPPVVAMGLTDQTTSVGDAFTYTFPTNAFSDADSDILTYTSSGQPTWLTFTANTRTFNGTPDDTDGSPFAITVTANDGKGSKVQATFVLTIPIGICDRTAQIQTALLSVIDGVTDCTLVTDAHLSGIADSLNLRSQSMTALKATDFSGLSSLRILNVYDNDLTTLPTGVFSGLSNLRFLSLYDNDLTTLPTNVFADLSNLRFLSLDNNGVSTLPDNVFSNLSNLQTLSLGNNGLSTLPAGVFSGLSSLRFLSLDNNEVSSLPDNVFSNLSNLQTLSLGSNGLSTLPANVFSGLSSLRRLDLSDNPGAPFKLTLQLERTDNMDLTAAGPATIKVKVAEGAPFDMTVGLSVTNGTLTDADGSAVTVAMISAGSTESAAITMTQIGSQPATVSLTGDSPAPPMIYEGLTTALGSSLVLFSEGVNRAPKAVGTIPAQTITVSGNTVTVDEATSKTVRVDVSSYFSDPDNDPLTYDATSNKESIAIAFAIDSDVGISPVSVGTATITVTALDATGSNMSVDQTIAVTVTLSPGICDRTSQVQSAILSAIEDVTDCALVTDTHLSGIRGTLDFRRQNITAVKAGDFAGLSKLRVLRLDRNELSSLPAKVFSGLSKLETLRLNHNQIATLPESVFSGLSSPGPTRLTLNNNSGAPFTLTLQLERTDNMVLTAAGPATIKIKIAEGAPFDMTVGLSVTNGTLTDADGSAVTEATISAGSTESAAITVTQSGAQQATVSLTGNPPAPPTAYEGLNTALGNALVLF